jgi:hypothetical protein
MLPFNRPASQKIITSTTLWTLSAAAIGFGALLITSASQLSSVAAGTIQGPLSLFKLEKTPATDGSVQASFAILPGLIWYIAAAFGIAVVISVIRLRSSRHAQS